MKNVQSPHENLHKAGQSLFSGEQMFGTTSASLQ